MHGTSGPRKRTVVAAWVGSTNLGDELIHRALVRRLLELGAEPVALSVAPDRTTRDHGVVAVHRRRLPAWSRLLRDGRLVFGGGGLIQGRSSLINLPYQLAPVGVARAARVGTVAVGLGASPLRLPERALVKGLLGPVPIGARDRSSARMLVGAGCRRVTVTADLALSLPSPARPQQDSIVVSLRPAPVGGVLPASRSWERGLPSDHELSVVATTLEGLASAAGLSLRFVALQPERDGVLHTRLAERVRRVEVSCVSPTVDTVLDELAGGRVIVGMRYHALVGAVLASRPAIALAYDEKVASLAEDAPRTVRLPGCRVTGLTPAHLDDALVQPSEARAGELAKLRQREDGNTELLERLLESR